MLYSRSLLCFIYVVLCICWSPYTSPNFTLCRPPSSFGDHRLIFYICDYFCFVNKFICTIFLDSTYTRYHILVFLWLASLSMRISQSFYVPANGIILFFDVMVNKIVSLMSWYRPCACIHSASLCLLIGAVNPFIFKIIINIPGGSDGKGSDCNMGELG